MFTTVLPVWGVALLLSVSCWSIGATLVSSRRPVVGMLAGWCVFLFLCTIPWILGLPANWVRPVFWGFFLAGIWLAAKRRAWADLTTAVVCTAAIVGVLGYPFIVFPGLLAYGAHGLDMWGYVSAAEWLQSHSIRQLPEIAVSPMRFNWTWHVLLTRERPLIYESLACLASATGLTPVQAYLAYPVTLFASLAMALAREPGIFRLKYWALALPLALVLVFHPLLVLPWIAGFFGSAVTAGFVALAFAGAVTAGEGPDRSEAVALGVLMILFCAALYTAKLSYVALALGGVCVLVGGIAHARRQGWRSLPALRPSRPMLVILGAIAVVTAALFVLGRDQPVDLGEHQSLETAGGHLLGMFGGPSPYVWFGFWRSRPIDREPLANPVGCLALAAMLMLFVVLIRDRWRSGRDLRVPLLLGLCAGVLALSISDETTMARTLTLFGFTLLIVLAAVSGELRHWSLGLLAAVVCCLPCIRSAAEMREIISGPYIMCTEENVANVFDGQDWRIMSYLAFREDRDGWDWTKTPRSYVSMTQFLPAPLQQRLAKKYHMPKR